MSSHPAGHRGSLSRPDPLRRRGHTGSDRPHIPSSTKRAGAPRAEPVWGLSSAGRATESHSVGHRLHHLRFASMAQPIVLRFARLQRDRLHQRILRQSRKRRGESFGALAQLGEHLLCKQGVTGSIPVGSTSFGRSVRHFGPGSVAQVVRAHA
jgi:hypothetical protein